MKNENLLDQFFLKDEKIVRLLVDSAAINKKDVVLEIGAGDGRITKEIAKMAGKVVAVEIDKGFQDELRKLPKNVEVIFGDALKVLDNNLRFDKIVSSLPSCLVEPLMFRLCRKDFSITSLLIPLKFVDFLQNNWVLNTYLKSTLVTKVDKESFDPRPKTNWALVKIIRQVSPLTSKDFQRYLYQFIYEHLGAKLKNSLVEAIVRTNRFLGNSLTKNQARKIISQAKITKEVLEKETGINTDYGDIINEVLKAWRPKPPKK